MSNVFIDRVLSMVRRETERFARKYHKPPRMGLVSSYDKKNHAVKVTFQPEGTESGWIPLTGLAVGNNWGIMSAPNINDQVQVDYHGGDHMVGRVSTRHWSTKNNPPQIDAGEHQITDKNGSTIYFMKDGTVKIGGASTMQVGQFADGQSGNISTGQTTGQTGQSQQQQQNNPPNAKQLITFKPDGTLQIDAPNNNYNNTTGQSHTITSGQNQTISAGGSITHTASQDHNIESTNGKIVHHAPSGLISLDSPTVLYEGSMVPGDKDPGQSGGGGAAPPINGTMASNNFSGPMASGLG